VCTAALACAGGIPNDRSAVVEISPKCHPERSVHELSDEANSHPNEEFNSHGRNFFAHGYGTASPTN
jgi:hypothetical protein